MLKIARYPRATDNRLHGHDKAVLGSRRAFLKAALINFILLQLLFFCLFCYIFGSLFQLGSHVHNLSILYVDYDGGIIGTAVRRAYFSMQGNGFPTLIEKNVAQYPTPDDMEKDVCSTKYWAAIYTSPGATNRLEQGMWFLAWASGNCSDPDACVLLGSACHVRAYLKSAIHFEMSIIC